MSDSGTLHHYFNSVCEFRQIFPVKKGLPLRANDPGLANIRDILNGLKEILQKKFHEISGIELKVKISLGISNLPNVLYACILPPGQMVPNGIYTAICFDILGRGVLAGCVESKVTSKGLMTVPRKKGSSLLDIDVDGASERTKYNNVFVNPKEFYYPLDDDEGLEEHIKKSLELCFGFLELNSV